MAICVVSNLGVNDVFYVDDLLSNNHFPVIRWYELGKKLGLSKNTLDVIENNHRHDASRCLTECLSKWLRRADNVDSKGGATIDSLINALMSMKENAVADKLKIHIIMENHLPSSQSLCDPLSTVCLLHYEERMLAKEVVTKVDSAPSIPDQCHVLLAAVTEAVQTDPNNLQTFARVLCEVSTNEQLGVAIQKDINKYFPRLQLGIDPQVTPSAPTGTNKQGHPPLSPIALEDIPDDRPTVSELIEFHELLIKGQLEESLRLLDADTIRKIRNAASADEGMSLLRRVFDEHPTLLHKMRDTKKINGSSQKTLMTAPSPALEPQQPSLTTQTPVTTPDPSHSPPIQQEQSQLMHVEPHSLSTVIELSSKEEVACSMESLHRQFTGLVMKIRKCLNELVSNGTLEPEEVAIYIEESLKQDLKLSEINMRTIFNAIRPHYDFFTFGLLKNLVYYFIPTSDDIHTKLTQYIDSVDKFSESAQLKHIRSTIKEKLSSLPAAASPTTSDQTKPVIIKLNDRWEEMTISKLKAVLKHYFGVTSDLFSHISFDYGSFVVTLLIPTSLSQSLIDTINNKTDSMSRLGILEVAVDKSTISIGKEDDNNFDISLHQSVIAGDSFEVSMLLQLGADPNSKDERGKSAIEIAIKGDGGVKCKTNKDQGITTITLKESQEHGTTSVQKGSGQSDIDVHKINDEVQETQTDKLLDIRDLATVLQELTSNKQFDYTDWYQLGLYLGLYERTLKAIEEESRGKLKKCLMECICSWLKGEDGVRETRGGGSNWISLVVALDAMGEREVANNIRIKYNLHV